MAYSFPFLLALQGLNGYNTAEFYRDVSLTCAGFVAQRLVLAALGSIFVRLVMLLMSAHNVARDGVADRRGP